MERRKYPRVPVQLTGFLLGNSHEVEGRTIDVSLGGAKFESELAVQPGKIIIVRLLLPGAGTPIVIDEALVRWIGEHQFGVEFQGLDSDDFDELSQLLDELDDVEGSGHA